LMYEKLRVIFHTSNTSTIFIGRLDVQEALLWQVLDRILSFL
jgi:hypothetical protein